MQPQSRSRYERALAIKPDYVEALNNRGNALRDLKRCQAAIASYDQALAINPGHVEALINRGIALQELGRFKEALASDDTALAIKPDHVGALINRGNTLRRLKRFEEGLASYDRALAIKADHLEALINRGNLLRDFKRAEDALTSYLGYPGTMGASFMDYVIADATVLPFDQQSFYTEKIIHLPDCYQVNDSRRAVAERTPSRAEAGLPEQ